MCYLAAPNRYALLEPHFRLPLLSWLSPTLRDRYVRIAGKGERYDVQPVTNALLRALVTEYGLKIWEVSEDVAREQLPTALAMIAPYLKRIYPTYIFLLGKPAAEEQGRLGEAQ